MTQEQPDPSSWQRPLPPGSSQSEPQYYGESVGGYSPAASYQSQSAPKSSWNLFAIASLVCAIFFVVPFSPILAIVFGHIARRQIRSNGAQEGKGLALAGLIIGYIEVAFFVVILIIYAFMFAYTMQ